MTFSSHLSLPCPSAHCTCNFTIKTAKNKNNKKNRFPLFSKEIQVKGGLGNGIFDFPHNPEVGKKKDFLWAAATTLIFYADKIFPSSKKNL